MRHKKGGRKFKKTRGQRKSLFSNLASSLILKEKIITTEARAKETRSFLEKSITRAKDGGLANQRLLAKNFGKEALKKLLKELGPRYKSYSGGYTKIIKINPRKSDSAKMVVMELIK